MKQIYFMLAIMIASIFGGCTNGSNEASYSDEQTVNDNNNVANGDVEQRDVGGIVDEQNVNVTESIVDGTSIFLKSVHFNFDNYTLTNEMRDISKENSEVISPVLEASNSKVKLEGNCDEWGSDEYNYALGLKRAVSAKVSLVEDGVDSNSISVVSLGESTPVCENQNAECWTKNRRVDYKLVP
jgi:peptidoglycan-associated lipoprotein